eukprot:UN32447
MEEDETRKKRRFSFTNRQPYTPISTIKQQHEQKERITRPIPKVEISEYLKQKRRDFHDGALNNNVKNNVVQNLPPVNAKVEPPKRMTRFNKDERNQALPRTQDIYGMSYMPGSHMPGFSRVKPNLSYNRPTVNYNQNLGYSYNSKPANQTLYLTYPQQQTNNQTLPATKQPSLFNQTKLPFNDTSMPINPVQSSHYQTPFATPEKLSQPNSFFGKKERRSSSKFNAVVEKDNRDRENRFSQLFPNRKFNQKSS